MNAMDTLTDAQRAVVEHYQGYNVPASWYVGEPRPGGSIEVIAVGDPGVVANDGGFVWSFIIEPDGECSTMEAPLGEFEIGLSI